MRIGRNAWIGAAGTLAIVLMAAHGAAARVQSSEKDLARAGAETNAKAAATRTVTDESGRRVTVPVNVQRIVSLAPNLTETVYALGLEDKLVGDTDFCDVPAAAKQKAHIGGPQNPSLEAIVALRPDLVLAAAIDRWETVNALTRLGIPVYTSDPHTVNDLLESVQKMAEVMGAEQRGAALAADLRSRLEKLQAKLADRPMEHVLFVVWEDPLITIGQKTFIADALRYAGAESAVLSDQDWPQLSFEEVVRLQPDYIVLAPDPEITSAAALADLRSRGGWRDLRAVELGHVAVMSDEVNKPSPGLVDAIEELAQELHPDAFARAAKESTMAQGSRRAEANERECATCAH